MTLKEMQEKRAKLLSDAQALITGADNVTAEVRAQFDKMLADAENLNAVISQMAAVEQAAAEQRNLPAPGQNMPEKEERSIEQQKKDFDKNLRNYLLNGETRDLTVSGNGVLIPTAVADPKIALKYAGAVYDLVGKWRTSNGEPLKAPTVNDTGNSFVLNSTGITTTDPTVAGPTISIDDLRSNPILIETSLLQDSSFDLPTFVQSAIQARYQRYVNQYITTGNSSNIGALNAISAGITTNTTLILKYVDFVSALAALDPSYAPNACWTMNNVTLGHVLQISDGNQRPLFLPYNDGATSKFVGQILGYPVRINPYLANYNAGVGTVSVQFGDFSQGYTFREVEPGVTVLRLNERYAELKKVGFVAFARVGGAVVDAGTHPILSLTGK